ncbi:hypothetical protein MASR1M32_12280 [Rhodobacter sp.]
MDLSTLYSAILPTLLQCIGAILGLLLIRATTYASTRWGIEIEARHREALHSAIMSGIRAALSKGLTGQAAVDSALVYSAGSVPDALAALDPSASVLQQLAEAKLSEVMKGQSAIMERMEAIVARHEDHLLRKT